MTKHCILTMDAERTTLSLIESSEKSVTFSVEYDTRILHGDEKSSVSETSGLLESSGNSRICKSQPSTVFQIIAIVACVLSVVFSMGFSFSLGVTYAQLVQEFDEDRSVVALIQSTCQGLLSVGGVFWGYPVTRLGYGYSVVIGGAIGSAAVIASAFAPNVPTMIVLIGGVGGICYGSLYLGGFVVAGHISERYRTVMIASASLGNFIGQTAMPAIMEYFIENYDWNGGLFLMGALCLNAIPAGLIMRITERNLGSRKKTGHGNTSFYKLYLFKQPMFCILMVNALFLSFSAVSEGRFMVDVAIIKGFDRPTGSFFITMLGVAAVIGGVTGPTSKLIFKLSSASHLAIWLFIISFSHLMSWLLSTYAGLLAASLLNGFCVANIFAHIAVALFEIYGLHQYATAFAFWNIFKGVGHFMGGFMGGVITDQTGSYDLLFQICVGLSMYDSVSFLGIVLYINHKPKLGYTRLK